MLVNPGSQTLDAATALACLTRVAQRELGSAAIRINLTTKNIALNAAAGQTIGKSIHRAERGAFFHWSDDRVSDVRVLRPQLEIRTAKILNASNRIVPVSPLIVTV